MSPYRDEAGARYVCLVCFRHVSSAPGLCSECGVDLLSLDDREVRDELRAEAERRMQKKQYGEYYGLSLLGFLIAIPILPIVGDFVYLGKLLYVAGAIAAGKAAMNIYTRVRPHSALALYAERRRRLALELAGTAPRALPASSEEDPERMGLDETLSWLGVKETKR